MLARWHRRWRAALRDRRTEAHRRRHSEDAAQPQDDTPLPGVPEGSDWAWRPPAWAAALAEPSRAPVESGDGFGPNLRVFHDCPRGEIAARQTAGAGPAPQGLRIEATDFEGSYLSLALAVPEAGLHGLAAHHILRLHASGEPERTRRLTIRLNLRQGPNVAQMTAPLDLAGADGFSADFDLAYAGLRRIPVAAAWFDVIDAEPDRAPLAIDDLIVSRRLRAPI